MLDPTAWAAPVIIAHRGSRLLWPENTMNAFSAAVDLGIQHVETDIRLSADGVVHCLHDANVDRTTEGMGPASALTAAELAELDAGYRHATVEGPGFRGKGLSIPTFEELATTFPDLRIVVDVKEDEVVEPFAALVERLGIGDRLIVGSSSDHRINRFRGLTRGGVATSSGSALSRRWLLASRVGRGSGGEASALQLPRQTRGIRVVDEKLVNVAHDRGLQVHVWTVNDPAEMEELLAMGVDGVVTDRPDLAISQLGLS